MSKTINATGNDFSEVVLKSNTPVLVDFWAPWCAPCRMMGPVLDELSVDLQDKAKIVKVDVENPDNQELAMQYGIRSIPSMKLFKDGNIIKEFMGMQSKDVLKDEIEETLK